MAARPARARRRARREHHRGRSRTRRRADREQHPPSAGPATTAPWKAIERSAIALAISSIGTSVAESARADGPERAPVPARKREREERPELPRAGKADDGMRMLMTRSRGRARPRGHPPRNPVRKRAGGEASSGGDEDDQPDQAEVERVAVDRVDLPADRDGHRLAGRARGGARAQRRVVPATEGGRRRARPPPPMLPSGLTLGEDAVERASRVREDFRRLLRLRHGACVHHRRVAMPTCIARRRRARARLPARRRRPAPTASRAARAGAPRRARGRRR